MRDFKFRILYTAQDGSQTLHYDDRLMIGLNGVVYENYGTKEKPCWENVFDTFELPVIQQSTECRDKNKMLIYEGDSVVYQGRTGTVKFFAGMFIVDWGDQTDDELGYLTINDLEVVTYKK